MEPDNPWAELRRRPTNDQSSSNNQNENGNNENSIPSSISSSTNPNPISNYNSANDYAMAVRAWLWAYQTWHMSQFLTPIYVQQFLFQQHQRLATNNGGLGNILSTFSPLQQTTILPVPQPATHAIANNDIPQISVGFIRLTGHRYVIPAFGRRLVSEAIDFVICFILSLFITYILVEFEVIELSRYEKLLSDQADLKTLIDVTQDLFPIEIGKKILTSFLEALFISYGFANILPGSTPGKYMMGLKVVRCVSVQAVAPRDYQVIVYGETERVSFIRALTRSMIKNFALGFLFPLCVTMYVFQFNRALYDMTAGTIVVEA